MTSETPKRRALISVFDKTGVVDLARKLVSMGWEILSTGGTARALVEAGLPVTPVEEYTGFPEMMDGRVKTLHPRVHGGILYRRDIQAHREAVVEHGMASIDMVVVNLYPFEAVVAKPDVDLAEAIENIDIGGPSMVRSAAKNHRDVYVVVNPDRYDEVIGQLEQGEGGSQLRQRLAREAFARTSAYDAAITTYLSRLEGGFPETLAESYDKAHDLRYGENPHQGAAFYRKSGVEGPSMGGAQLVHGAKALSYNNYLDADAALRLALDLPSSGACILKHCNPCGAAVADDMGVAFERALEGDPVSAFGGIVGLNRDVDLALAQRMAQPGTFFEVIIAPSFTPEAVEHIAKSVKWGKNVRLLAVGDMTSGMPPALDVRSITGGLLAQDRDDDLCGGQDPECVTERAPTAAERISLDLAWVLVKHVRSNAIVFVRDGALAGVGAGQMSRVGSVKIAARHAGEKARGAAMGSDAFFPFPDGIEAAAEAGVTSVIQPGGSRKDKDAIAACNERNMTMLLTGMRHFRH